MFERYDETAQQVIDAARQQANQLGSFAIEPEHVLLGLVQADAPLMESLLGDPAATQSISRQLTTQCQSNVKRPDGFDLLWSHTGIGVLRRAAHESERLGHPMVSPEHLLIGLLQEEGSLAAQLLRVHGLTLEQVQAHLSRQLSSARSSQTVSPTTPTQTAVVEPVEAIEASGPSWEAWEAELAQRYTNSSAATPPASTPTIEGAPPQPPASPPTTDTALNAPAFPSYEEGLLAEPLFPPLREALTPPVQVKPKRIRKAVFPAAGLGTRFLPATKAQPKEMLPLVDKPLIQYVVEEAIDSGIEQIIVVTGRGKNSIEDHFDISYELEQMLAERGKERELDLVRHISDMAQFAYVRQKQALGLGHAVLAARDVVDGEAFAVMLGDDIIDAETPCIKQMIEVYERYGAPVIGIMPINGPEISRFGVIAGTQIEPQIYRITDMVEKPRPEEAPSNLAIIGRYILTPDIFDEILTTAADAQGEIQLTDAMRSLLRKRPFYAYQFEGRRYDAGDKLGFLIATVEFALKHEDISEAFRQYLRNLKL